MPHTLPFPITAGDEIAAEPLQSDFQSLSDMFQARITGADMSPNAGIAGTQLAAASVGSDRLLAWSLAEVVRLLPALGIGGGKLKVIAHEVAASHNFGSAPTADTQNVFLASEVNAGNWRGRASVWATVAGVQGHGRVTVNPSIAFPSTTYQLLGVYAKDPIISGTSVNFTARFIFLAQA